MSFASGGQSTTRPGRRYRGSAKRVRQLSSQQNTPVNLLILLLLTMIVLLVVLWIGEYLP